MARRRRRDDCAIRGSSCGLARCSAQRFITCIAVSRAPLPPRCGPPTADRISCSARGSSRRRSPQERSGQTNYLARQVQQVGRPNERASRPRRILSRHPFGQGRFDAPQRSHVLDCGGWASPATAPPWMGPAGPLLLDDCSTTDSMRHHVAGHRRVGAKLKCRLSAVPHTTSTETNQLGILPPCGCRSGHSAFSS